MRRTRADLKRLKGLTREQKKLEIGEPLAALAQLRALLTASPFANMDAAPVDAADLQRAEKCGWGRTSAGARSRILVPSRVRGGVEATRDWRHMQRAASLAMYLCSEESVS